jgi:hypothetical protein
MRAARRVRESGGGRRFMLGESGLKFGKWGRGYGTTHDDAVSSNGCDMRPAKSS